MLQWTVLLLDKIYCESPSLPLICFLSHSPASFISFFSTLTYNYHMHSLLSLCVTVTKFHFSKLKSGVCSNEGRFFCCGFSFLFLMLNHQHSTFSFFFFLFFSVLFSPTNPSVWESIGSGNHVAWDAGFFVYYIKRM